MSGRVRPKISATQVTASGVGTVIATVAGSYLGVTGTLLGAGLMSALTTTGNAVVQHYLDRGSRRVREVTIQKISPSREQESAEGAREDDGGDQGGDGPAGSGPPGAGLVPPARKPPEPPADPRAPSERTVQFVVPAELSTGGTSDASGTSGPGDAPGTVEFGAVGDPGPGGSGGPDAGSGGPGGGTGGAAHLPAPGEPGDGDGGIRWKPVVIRAVLVFAVVMAGVFVFEMATGKPLASTVRGEQGTGTSLTGGRVVPATPTPQPPSESPEPSSVPTTTPPATRTAVPSTRPRPSTRPPTAPPTRTPPVTTPPPSAGLPSGVP